MIKTTSQAEIDRMNAKPKWGYLQTFSLAEAVHKAVDMGWAEKKVQVRWEPKDGQQLYTVEPFEKDCGCPSILKYQDYAPERSSSEG